MDTSTAVALAESRYPLHLRFKRLALSPQITVTDAAGNVVFYVKQKAFKLKEAVTVFADLEQSRPLFTIKADRVLDFGAQYRIADTAGRPLGHVQRQGMRSIWRAHFEIATAGGAVLTLREENPWVKVLDGLVGDIPVIGLFSGYFLNPTYLVSRADGTAVLRLKKEPALTEGKYSIHRLAPLEAGDETTALLGVMMMTLLERSRG